MYVTADDHHCVVHMERSKVPGTNIITTETNAARGLGDLMDIEAKFRALLIGRMWLQSTRKGSATAICLQGWNLSGPRANPPDIERFPTNLDYLYRYALDMACIAPPGKV